jgi:copper(I)-binding protein
VRVRLVVSLALLTVACSDPGAPLQVSDAWVRAMPPGTVATAAYVSLENRSDEARTLTSITSPRFARVELHETRTEDGVARMRRVDALVLAPGERVTLAPGALHLMLLEPLGAIAPDDRVPLRFQLDDGWILEIEAEVRAP